MYIFVASLQTFLDTILIESDIWVEKMARTKKKIDGAQVTFVSVRVSEAQRVSAGV
jgi:hypothetical protein